MTEDRRRRTGDPEDFDPRAHRLRNGRQDILQAVLKYGLSTFLVLYFLGVFASFGLRSPFMDFKQELAAHDQRMDERDQRVIDLMRGICLGVWDSKALEQQRFCNR